MQTLLASSQFFVYYITSTGNSVLKTYVLECIPTGSAWHGGIMVQHKKHSKADVTLPSIATTSNVNPTIYMIQLSLLFANASLLWNSTTPRIFNLAMHML